MSMSATPPPSREVLAAVDVETRAAALRGVAETGQVLLAGGVAHAVVPHVRRVDVSGRSGLSLHASPRRSAAPDRPARARMSPDGVPTEDVERAVVAEGLLTPAPAAQAAAGIDGAEPRIHTPRVPRRLDPSPRAGRLGSRRRSAVAARAPSVSRPAPAESPRRESLEPQPGAAELRATPKSGRRTSPPAAWGCPAAVRGVSVLTQQRKGSSWRRFRFFRLPEALKSSTA